MNDCVLCDWVMDWEGTPWYVYRAGEQFPLTWRSDQTEPTTVLLTSLIVDTVPGCALVYHWSQAHPEQLRALIGEHETDSWPRRGP